VFITSNGYDINSDHGDQSIVGHDHVGLARIARQLNANHPGQHSVIITPHSDASYELVVATLDAIRGSKEQPWFSKPVFAGSTPAH
jgi:hypothetical protein